ncbi:MAG: hypothetical protein O2984_05930 [Bacteroidetes bacterium]|nr:hypothetical protein [Bacteroidota bacterium]
MNSLFHQSADHLFDIQNNTRAYASGRYHKSELERAEVASLLQDVELVFNEGFTVEIEEALASHHPETLLQYLQKSHDLYLNARLYEIEQTLDWLALEIGRSHPYLKLLRFFLMDYRQELTKHIHHEESLLFPALSKLFQEGKSALNSAEISLITGFKAHHEDTEVDLKMLRKVLREYVSEGLTYSSFRVLLNRLKSLELDLQVHHILEDHVLIPFALNALKQ